MSFKKTQASVFMIIGVVLVIIILMYLLLSQTNRDVQLQSGFDDVDMNMPIKACIDLELDNALIKAGYQAGYVLDIPSDYIENFYSGVPFWLYNGLYTGITKEMIEEEISIYLNYTVPLCIDLTMTQSPVTVENIETSTSIYDDRVVVDMEIAARLTEGDSERKTGRFIASKDVYLGKIIDQAEASIFEIMDVGGIPLTWIAQTEYPMFVTEREEGSVLEIVDYDNEIKGQPYSFFYGVSLEEPDNFPPVLFEEGPFKGYIGEEIYIDYDAEDDAYENQLEFSIVTFEPYNDMEINETTGIITYVPQIEGRYTAYVRVTDVEDLTDTQYLEIEVEQR